jgi:hypothetical protein
MAAKWWERVEMPTGNIVLPDWCLDVRINWYDGYANWPELKVKAAHCPAKHEDLRWENEGNGYYRAYTNDGIMDQLKHDGRLTLDEASGAYVSTQQEGFAKRSFTLKMKDGSTVILRGPWSTIKRSGWTDFSYADMEYEAKSGWGGRPWETALHMAGLAMNEDLFARIVARFLPHLRCARVSRLRADEVHMEVTKDGEPPKGLTFSDERTLVAA